MSKNKLNESFLLCVILIGSLLFIYLIPEFSVGPIHFKRVDILADLKTYKKDSVFLAIQDSIEVKQDSVIKLVEERCKPGITCIEDYSGDSTALKTFFTALEETKRSKKRLRVAFYGDSFIEGVNSYRFQKYDQAQFRQLAHDLTGSKNRLITGHRTSGVLFRSS